MISMIGSSILFGTVTSGLYISLKYSKINLLDIFFDKMFMKKKRKIRTIIDVQTCDEAEHFVRTIDRGGGGDELAGRLFSIYSFFRPSEESMQYLSIMYDTCHNEGGAKEFAVTLLYAVTTDVLCIPVPSVAPSICVCMQSSPCLLQNSFDTNLKVVRSYSF